MMKPNNSIIIALIGILLILVNIDLSGYKGDFTTPLCIGFFIGWIFIEAERWSLNG
jgi:hypothetical protein